MNVIVDPPFRLVYLAVVIGIDIRSVEPRTTIRKIRDSRFLFMSSHTSMNSKLTLREDIFKD